jgi:hypothetical protein
MMKLLHFPTNGRNAMAFGQPLSVALAALEACAESLQLAREKAPSKSESFGEKVKAAVRRKTGGRATAITADEHSFGQKIKQAVLRRAPQAMSCKAHEAYKERERARYRAFKQRPHTKSE